MRTSQTKNPWYKEFWAWFIFTPLLAIVGVMSVLIYFAYSSRDSVVTDNYQKKGRMLEASFEAQNYAKELGLQALVIDINGATHLLLSASQAVYAPTLSFYLEHPFEQELDSTLRFSLINDNQNQDARFDKAKMLLKNKASSDSKLYIYKLNEAQKLSGKRYLRASYYTSTPASIGQADEKIEVWRLSGETHFDQSSYTFLTP